MDADSYFDTDAPRRGKKKEKEEFYISQKPDPRVFAGLADVDMDRELATQIAEATSLRDHVMNNLEAFQMNHVTDTIKTVNSLLAQAVKIKEAVQTVQRMKDFEDAVIETMKTQPEEVKEEFFRQLKAKL